MTGESQDSRNMAVLVWIGTIFLWFVPGLLAYLLKRDDAYVRDHGVEALNWSITAALAMLVGRLVLSLIFLGWLAYTVVYVAHVVFCIMGAIAATNGQRYSVPFAVRLIR
jgi:uncharacterized Tic20 family protein